MSKLYLRGSHRSDVEKAALKKYNVEKLVEILWPRVALNLRKIVDANIQIFSAGGILALRYSVFATGKTAKQPSKSQFLNWKRSESQIYLKGLVPIHKLSSRKEFQRATTWQCQDQNCLEASRQFWIAADKNDGRSQYRKLDFAKGSFRGVISIPTPHIRRFICHDWKSKPPKTPCTRLLLNLLSEIATFYETKCQNNLSEYSSMSKPAPITLVSGDFEVKIAYHKLALICLKFAETHESSRLCPGHRYELRTRTPRDDLEQFVNYIKRRVKSKDAKDIITKANYKSFVSLAEEFQSEKLKKDLESFKASWDERVDDLVRELSGLCDDDERGWSLEDEISDDIESWNERIRATPFSKLSVTRLGNILAKSREKGRHINSTELCRYILSRPSYCELMAFVNLGEVRADVALQVIQGDETQTWVTPEVFFPFMDQLLSRLSCVETELETSKGNILALEAKSAAVMGELSSKNEALQAENNELLRRIEALEECVRRTNATFGDAISCLYRSPQKTFVLSWLRERELNEKRKLFVVRQSSNDIYSWLDPDSDFDQHGSSDGENAWIKIEFPTPIRVNGLKVTSNYRNEGFPKTFVVIFSDNSENGEERTIPFDGSDNLNGPGLSVEKEFEVFSAKVIRIESRGPNSSGDNYFRLGGFELFSPEEKYRDGVFRSIFMNHRDNFYDFFDVQARDFDWSEIHKRDTMKEICTFDWSDHEWLEAGLVCGKVAIFGYRIRKNEKYLRSWSLRGSNDRNLPLEEWTVIHRHCEEEKTSKELQFECFSGTPFRFFRIVQEGNRWDGARNLRFNYFDFDGIFVPD